MAEPFPFVLGIVGDSGSGKSTISDGVRALIGPERVTDLKLDDYQRFTRAERMERGITALNPQVHDFPLMQAHLQLLRKGKPVRNRSYRHADGTFGPSRLIEPREVVLVRGLLGFPTDELRSAYDLAVFLHPEPELLFRWKLRRDVHSRGYSEAEVLGNIAQHLLDSKEFLLPQAERADLVVRYTLPRPDAPDTEVRTALLVRRAAAELLSGETSRLARFGGAVQLEEHPDGVVLHLDPELDETRVRKWARERFPETFSDAEVGTHLDDSGTTATRAQLVFLETLIARLARLMRRERTFGSDSPAIEG